MKFFLKKLSATFEEINIFNCIGLILELMTKHSCWGVKLPENTFFIWAWNPYRNYKIKFLNPSDIKILKEKMEFR